MTAAAIYIVIGILIGWNIPQPSFAKTATDKIVSWVKSKF